MHKIYLCDSDGPPYWWNEGTNNLCGLELYNISTLLGFSQLINKPTNFEPNKTPSCIDLIFTSKPNLVFGIRPSLYNMCLHQIIYANISLKIHFPPSYKRDIWHYNRAQVDLIKKVLQINSALRYHNRLHKKYISGGRTEDDKINLRNNTNLA